MDSSIPETSIKQSSYWAVRTRLEKNLMFFLLFLVLIIITLSVLLATIPQNSDKILLPQDECTTVECLETAKMFISNMNSNMDPCEDFYEFSCGGFLNRTTIPPELASVDSFSSIAEALHTELNSLLLEPSNEKDSVSLNVTKDYFAKCNDIFAIEEGGIKTFQGLIDNNYGWPTLWKNHKNSHHYWSQRLIKLYKSGLAISSPFCVGIDIDDKNTSTHIIKITPPDFSLNREYLVKGEANNVVKAYKKYIESVAKTLGADEHQAKRHAQSILDLEIKLALASPPIEEMRNPYARYHSYTLTELNRDLNIFGGHTNWVDFLNQVYHPHARVSGSDKVIITSPKYFQQLKLIFSKTDPETIDDIIMWKFVYSLVPYSTQVLRKHLQEYNVVARGIVSSHPRWKICVDTTNNLLDTTTGSVYIKKYFSKESKNQIANIVTEIMGEFKSRLEMLPWMDDVTRQAAMNKVKKMSMHVGYSEEILDPKILDDYYNDLNITGMTYMESTLEICKHSHVKDLLKLGKPVNMSDWTYHIGQTAEVNAYYMGIQNSIALPAGILRGIFYSVGRPKYLNYGGIGFIVGHEITHGFDDEGSQMNEDGNLKNWWANETRKEYLEKAQCFVEQYSNYTYDGMNLNGINTLGENLADNGGLGVVYSAYSNWLQKNGQEKKLPGLPYTNQQMFWLSAANSWCSVQRPENAKFSIITDTHSLSRFRVLGPMSNLAEFAKDFQCPVGSKMNPEKKCKVW